MKRHNCNIGSDLFNEIQMIKKEKRINGYGSNVIAEKEAVKYIRIGRQVEVLNDNINPVALLKKLRYVR